MQIIITSTDFKGEDPKTIKRYFEEAIGNHSVLKDFNIQLKVLIQYKEPKKGNKS